MVRLFKTYQRIRVLLLQGVVLGGGIQRQQCRAFLCFAVVVLQFFVRNADEFGEIQSLQLGFGQFFQTFVRRSSISTSPRYRSTRYPTKSTLT